MTTLQLGMTTETAAEDSTDLGRERRAFRRHDLEHQAISIDRWNGGRSPELPLGTIIDLSPGGVRLRTRQASIKPDQQIRVRLELPAFAGICPFVDTSTGQPQPKREWVGWMTVSRVNPVGGRNYEVAGRLVDMEEIDRGMLGLYLSTQPLAA